MKNLFLFSGRHRIDELGATFIVMKNLFLHQTKQISKTIFSIGTIPNKDISATNVNQNDVIQKYLKKNLLHRVILKILNILSSNISFITYFNTAIYYKMGATLDEIVSKKLDNNNGQSVIVGFSGSSILVGRKAQRLGYKYVIHSQWCHPNVQHKLISQGYKQINQKPPQTNKKQIQQQLDEYELSDLIWCPSKFVQKSLLENNIPRDKTFVSYLGIDLNRFLVKKRIDKNNFQILFVGTVCIQKGIHVLLNALSIAEIENVQVILNGKSDKRTNIFIKKYSQKLLKKKIQIILSPGDPRRYLSSASIFILPSVHDAFGIVVLEAMASSLPIIISDKTGACEIIQDGSNGFIFESGNVIKLAKKIEFFFNNQEAIIQFGKSSLKLVQDFEIKNQSKKLQKKLFN